MGEGILNADGVIILRLPGSGCKPDVIPWLRGGAEVAGMGGPQLALCRFSGYSLVAAMQVGVTQASATSPPEPLAATAARLAQPGWPHGVKGSS